MKGPVNNWQFLLAGLYTWLAATFFGAILLNIVYSNVAVSALKPSEAADFLLLIGALTILAGIGAVGSSWGLGSARIFLLPALYLSWLSSWLPCCFSRYFKRYKPAWDSMWVRGSG